MQERPSPIPAPDRYQIETLNELYLIAPPAARQGWSRFVLGPIWRVIVRVLSRQQNFNAAVVDHLNRDAVVGLDAHVASLGIIDWAESTLAFAADNLRRQRESLVARERRGEAAVASLAAAHQELRAAVGVLQQATQTLKREVARLAEAGVAQIPNPKSQIPSSTPESLDSYKYVGFEDRFRGSPEDIRQRVSEYLPVFTGASDVLDVGCGRGEFLELLREHGVRARGIDVNQAMIDICRGKGLDATAADALGYLRAQPDGSLGGLFAAQVVEHLEPGYLTRMLDAAFDKLRPGSPIVLETINPACWFAFFESYVRDITHVRPLHPDTLEYLLVASGFQQIDIRYRAPYPDSEKLQQVAATTGSPLADWAETLNANVEKINRLLFTWLDYAAIGRRP
jgi:SAM-dependent methyltransferase